MAFTSPPPTPTAPYSLTPPLQGPGAAAKKRRSLLQALRGCYGEVAAGGSGSHFVEKCYALGVGWKGTGRARGVLEGTSAGGRFGR
jgi:hypothetical protein